jgi:hypothetical protein
MYESLIFRRCWPYVEFLTRFILGAIFYFIVFFNFRLEYSFDCEWLRRCVRCRNERRKKQQVLARRFISLYSAYYF